MSTHITYGSSIRTEEGQVVSKITITIDEAVIPVIPVGVAAIRMGYTVRHINLLCDTGKLIAFKIAGRWLVSEHSASLYPDRDGHDGQFFLE